MFCFFFWKIIFQEKWLEMIFGNSFGQTSCFMWFYQKNRQKNWWFRKNDFLVQKWANRVLQNSVKNECCPKSASKMSVKNKNLLQYHFRTKNYSTQLFLKSWEGDPKNSIFCFKIFNCFYPLRKDIYISEYLIFSAFFAYFSKISKF